MYDVFETLILVIRKRLNETLGLRIHSRRVFVRQRSYFSWKIVRHFLKKEAFETVVFIIDLFSIFKHGPCWSCPLNLKCSNSRLAVYSRGTTSNRASAAVFIGDLEEKVYFHTLYGVFASIGITALRMTYAKLISFSISRPLPTVHLKTVRVILDTCTTRCWISNFYFLNRADVIDIFVFSPFAAKAFYATVHATINDSAKTYLPAFHKFIQTSFQNRLKKTASVRLYSLKPKPTCVTLCGCSALLMSRCTGKNYFSYLVFFLRVFL